MATITVMWIFHIALHSKLTCQPQPTFVNKGCTFLEYRRYCVFKFLLQCKTFLLKIKEFLTSLAVLKASYTKNRWCAMFKYSWQNAESVWQQNRWSVDWHYSCGSWCEHCILQVSRSSHLSLTVDTLVIVVMLRFLNPSWSLSKVEGRHGPVKGLQCGWVPVRRTSLSPTASFQHPELFHLQDCSITYKDTERGQAYVEWADKPYTWFTGAQASAVDHDFRP